MRREAEISGLAGAFGASIAAHLLLLLLALWLPVGLLHFRFEKPPQPEPQDRTVSFVLPEPRFEAPLQASARQPPQPITPATGERSRSEPSPAPLPRAQPQAAVPPARAPSAGSEPDSGEREPPQNATKPASAPSSRHLDLNRAFEQFGERLENGSPDKVADARPRQGFGEGFAPDLSGLPTTGTSLPNLQFESVDYDWHDYGRQIYIAIWRAWHNRLWATTNDFERWAHEHQRWHLGHRTRVRFAIESNGQVTGIAIENLSGCEPLDASAVDALAEVVLPPLPADFARSHEVVHAWFLAEGEILSMRAALNYYKARGLF